MNKILRLLDNIKELRTGGMDDISMPGNVFYLNETDIVCMERKDGFSRYPYDMDGLNLWVRSDGHITANESNLIIFRTPYSGDEPTLEFWGGIKNGNEWIPVSVTGVTAPLYESIEVKRYTVYCSREAYYISETEKYVFAVRACVTTDKKIHFTTYAINKCGDSAELYIAAYISPTLRFVNDDNEWAPWMRVPKMYEDTSCTITRFSNPEDNDITNIAVISADVVSSLEFNIEKTVSKNTFLNGGKSIHSAYSLRSGGFEKEIYSINTVDMPIYSAIGKFVLNSNESFCIDFSLRVVHENDEIKQILEKKHTFDDITFDIKNQQEKQHMSLSGFDINFDKLNNINLSNNLFNRFLKNVRRQVELCAFGKNYHANMLGMRDVYQQLTAAIAWNSSEARNKMLRALNYIMSNGRVPRQISIPDVEGVIPEFDIRLYIDQGFWIIETFHKYISFTGDYTILDEICSYYEIIDEKKKQYKKSATEDTALEHLIKITDFLISNIDEETGCLKILHGDWNDAVNGLGMATDGEGFGNGVSVMATLQLYKSLMEMSEILTYKGICKEKCNEFNEIRDSISHALETYALQKDGEETHILHGWGDKGSYKIGSIKDSDGKKRYSSTVYSFWCISGMLKRDITLKPSIMSAYKALDSKYGLMTFNEPFPRDMKGVGMITTLTPGIGENACTYVHAATFAIMSLFIMGEPEEAWNQIFKVIPITHNSVNKSPFVMPNSYCCNQDMNIDGESLNDWYTGSGAVLTRCIFEYGMGVMADLCGIKISTPAYMPSDSIKAGFKAKGKNISFAYHNTNSGTRKYYINDIEIESKADPVSGNKYIYIDNSSVIDDMEIKVVD